MAALSTFTGMMWADHDPKLSLLDKILGAAAYYTTKYHAAPDVCFVHPTALNGNPATPQGITVLPHKSVLHNNFWIGVVAQTKQTKPTAQILTAQAKQKE